MNARRIAIVALLSSGCSLVFVKGPPACSTGSAAPTIDVVAGVTLGLGAFGMGMIAASFDGWDCDGDCRSHEITAGEWAGIGLFAAAVAAPWIASSIVGRGRIHRCLAAHRG